MPTTTRTVYLTDENGNPLIDEQRNLRTLSFSLMQGYSYRLVERASIVSATYAQVVGYSTATGQTISGVENASEFDVGDFGIVQYAISDRNNTIGYVTCKVTAVGADSLTVNGIGISVSGADGADGKDGAPGADGKDGAATVQIGTVTTGAAGSQASVTNVGADNAAVLNFTIPRGDTGAAGRDGTNGQDGAPGAAATIQIGQVLTGEPGTNASVENVGTSNAAILNITIPRGNPGTNGTNGTDGAPGQDGSDGAAATIQIGEVVTGAAGTNAIVENTGTENAAVLKFTIPRGATGTPGADGKDGVTFTPSVDTTGDLSWSNDGGLPNPETVNLRGAQGEAATVQVGQVTTLPAGSQATVTNSGTNQAAVLNFGIPTGATGADGKDGADGAPGAAATIQIGTVTTGAAGSQAAVTNTGTANAAILNFTIPRGNTGAQGNPGNDGAPGADGASGVTDVTAGTPTEQNGYTVTPVTFNFEQGNSKTVNIRAKNGEGGGAGVQQNAVINRTASVTTADENSPDFVENNGDLWVKKIAGYKGEMISLEETLPRVRQKTSAATAPNGKIYVFGGRNSSDSYFADILEFDPITQAVTTLEATLPSARSCTSAATAPNGKIYVFGGRNSSGDFSDIIEFDPASQSVTTLNATLPSARRGTSAATAANGKIYVFGGGKATAPLDDIVEFDPVAQTVTTLDVTLSARTYASAATAPNGKIYVFGGLYANGARSNIIEFDPVSKSTKAISSSGYGFMYSSAATAPNGKIYVFDIDIVEFDPVAQTVTTLDVTPSNNVRSSSAATAPNGKIYVFGGTFYGNSIFEFNVYATTIFAYRKIITADASGAVTVGGTVTASSFNATT